MAMAHRGAVRIVAACRTDDLIDLGFQQLVQHPQPDAHAQCEQALLRSSSQLAERVPHARGKPLNATLARQLVGLLIYGPHAVLRSSRTWFRRLSRSPPERTRREDRRPSSSTSYGSAPRRLEVDESNIVIQRQARRRLPGKVRSG